METERQHHHFKWLKECNNILPIGCWELKEVKVKSNLVLSCDWRNVNRIWHSHNSATSSLNVCVYIYLTMYVCMYVCMSSMLYLFPFYVQRHVCFRFYTLTSHLPRVAFWTDVCFWIVMIRCISVDCTESYCGGGSCGFSLDYIFCSREIHSKTHNNRFV